MMKEVKRSCGAEWMRKNLIFKVPLYGQDMQKVEEKIERGIKAERELRKYRKALNETLRLLQQEDPCPPNFRLNEKHCPFSDGNLSKCRKSVEEAQCWRTFKKLILEGTMKK